MSNIILVGFMGCGKSSVGIRLSYSVKKTFIDTDKSIEKAVKRKISDIFALRGEAYFRDLETNQLKKLIEDKEEHVISVGGGLPMREENRALLKELGTVIYLKANVDTIYNRIKKNKKRPLLQTPNPKETIKELLEEREPIYESIANYTICVDKKRFRQIIREICALCK
ncbi:MAG: shikimate kinase [Lachnospiraceae bacterium]